MDLSVVSEEAWASRENHRNRSASVFTLPIYVMIVGADSRAVHTAIRQDDRPRYQ
jgi:hypothetical protein